MHNEVLERYAINLYSLPRRLAQLFRFSEEEGMSGKQAVLF